MNVYGGGGLFTRTLLSGIVAVAILSGCGDMRKPDVGSGDASAGPVELTRSPVANGRVREPAVAGPKGRGFYSDSPVDLAEQVDRCLGSIRKKQKAGRLVAAVVPHAGYVYSGKCAGSIYGLIENGDYDTVIILGPTHRVGFSGIAMPGTNDVAYRTPLGDVAVDRSICFELEKTDVFRRLPIVDPKGLSDHEHCIEVQIPFLQRTLGKFKLVPLLCGELSAAAVSKAGEAIAAQAKGKTLVLASTDFTHYGARFGYVPFRQDVKNGLHSLLARAAGLVARVDTAGFDKYLSETGDTICGKNAIRVLLEVLKQMEHGAAGKVLDSYTSGDVTGDYGSSVSYAAIGFFVQDQEGE